MPFSDFAGNPETIHRMRDMLARKRFPHAVYYKVDGDVCIVFRVLDCRQEPEKTRDALK